MFTKHIFVLLISSSLVACATSEPDPLHADFDALPQGTDCIFEGTIRDYQVLDDENLVVTASARRKYHIELFRRAYGLRSSWHLGFRSPTNRICPSFSEVIVDNNVGRAEAIRIESIRELSPEEHEELMIRFGKMEPDVPQTPAEDVVDTAEVEELD